MQILKWLLVNWDSVLLIAMVVALIIYLIKTGQTKILKQIAIKFVTDACLLYTSDAADEL